MIELNKIYCEDCLETMSRMPDNFVDSIIADPPYGIGFMGKEWDNFKPAFIEKKTANHLPIDHKLQSGRSASMHAGLYDISITGNKKYQNWCEQWAKECLRVLKPGGHLLSFGGTRTYHRMACAIEDAGFEIRDQIQWLYGSGFPKSLDVSKAIDKKAEENIEIIKAKKELGQWLKKKRGNRKQSDISKYFLSKTGGLTGCVANWELGFNLPTWDIWIKLKSILDLDDRFDYLIEGRPLNYIEAEREIIGKSEFGASSIYGSKIYHNRKDDKILDITIPATPEAQQWEGWGTALKPANEPICMARKPLSEKTVAENVLKWGTGGINVDGCRIETDKDSVVKEILTTENTPQGRWPANVIHDGSEEVLREFPNSKSTGGINGKRNNDYMGLTKGYTESDGIGGYGDSGSAARFYYCAKASKAERDAGCEGMERSIPQKLGMKNDPEYLSSDGYHRSGFRHIVSNNHPTVKPIALMRYLCRLITPPKGTIYDPFIGSGTTGIAAGLEDFNFIGSEIEKDSCRIAEKRIAFHRAQLKLQYD